MCHILSKLPRLPPNVYTSHPNPKGILGMAYLTAGTTGVAHRRPGRLTGAPPSFTGGDRVLCVVTPGVFSLASRLALSRPPSPQSALLDVEKQTEPTRSPGMASCRGPWRPFVSTSRPIPSRWINRPRVGQGPAGRSTGRFRFRSCTNRGERGLHEEGTKREEAKGAELIGSVTIDWRSCLCFYCQRNAITLRS